MTSAQQPSLPARHVFARAARAPVPAHPLLDRLWSRYVVDVPYAARFSRLHEGPVVNDHIALRTLAAPAGPGIASFARVFEDLGWRHGGDYEFPDVHLRAVYLKRFGFPRVFISELDPNALPDDARRALVDAAAAPFFREAPPAELDALAWWFREPPPPSGAKIDVVGKASQYGAWLLAFGRKVNHFTAAVDDVELWQTRLLQAGVPMKVEVEGARGGDLRQTATHAAAAHVILDDGSVRTMPYAYFEIAERHRGFDGFLAPQARQLFEMTAPLLGGGPLRPQAAGSHEGDHIAIDDIAAPYASQRKHPRKDAVVPVEIAWGGGAALRRALSTQNLSLSGAYLSFPDDGAPPVGTVVELSFALPRGLTVHTAGKIVWRMEKGAGVELTWWDDDDEARVALASFLDGLP